MTHISSTIHVPDVSETPRHIAIILDGNGRWAQKRRLPRVAGHTRGVDAVRTTVEGCVKRGVTHLTLFAFSSENWRRPQDEVSFLMRLFVMVLEREVARMHANNIRLRIIGDLSRFDDRIRDLVRRAEAKTANNSAMTLTIAANYGGRWDILQATRKIAEAAAASGQVGEIDERSFERHLALADAPEPDLFIRTGGEQRISNFLLWQLAYTELYFTDLLWPDFDEAALDAACQSYGRRERRFGRTSAQLQPTGRDALPC
ncbi:polyprenyl diphosphate synthase [Chitinasiproducens palmae]|uniref:Isoprenyl transferase n=1 Tax=Chitinasiproducens palmae TaxID=1770053 RepID=A0A1H2PMU4_9BURK|nr:polyprenyl diphosphate synthase [Chitinasiproducens palmae]SDV47475.1 Undecaprenyl pyrophosphate synthetase [Chitinasiproducens palmae]